MYKITSNELRIMQQAAELGVFRMGDAKALGRLLTMCGVAVTNTTCSRCYVDAAIHCFHIIRRGGYEVQD